METGSAPARPALIEQAAAVRDILVTEILLSANGTPLSGRELKLSTAGLADSIVEFRQRCDGSRRIQQAAPPMR